MSLSFSLSLSPSLYIYLSSLYLSIFFSVSISLSLSKPLLASIVWHISLILKNTNVLFSLSPAHVFPPVALVPLSLSLSRSLSLSLSLSLSSLVIFDSLHLVASPPPLCPCFGLLSFIWSSLLYFHSPASTSCPPRPLSPSYSFSFSLLFSFNYTPSSSLHGSLPPCPPPSLPPLPPSLPKAG